MTISATLDRIDGARVLKLVKRLEGYAGRLKQPIPELGHFLLWLEIALGVGNGQFDIDELERLSAPALTKALAQHKTRQP
jgi:hypothetical protein